MIPIFPTAYFGPISYFKDILNCQNVLIEIHENYIKQTYRNRMVICTANGKLELSIPVIKINGNKTAIKDVIIDNNQKWQRNHWKAIESAYRHAAYFEHYENDIKNLIYQHDENLIRFNEKITNTLINWLELPINLSKTTEFLAIEKEDYRQGHSLSINNKMDYNYFQVFSDKNGFIENLSLLDAIFNIGPMARKILIK